MFKFIVVVAFLANLSYISTVPTSSEESSYYQNAASDSSESWSSSYSSSTNSESTSSSNISYSDVNSQCNSETVESEQPTTTTEAPTTTIEQPTTTPEQPTTTPEQPNTSPTVPSGNATEDFERGILKITARFFYNVVKENPGKSVIMSPYSTTPLLAALALRGQGETAEQILNALNFKNKDEIFTAFKPLLDSIEEQKNVTLTFAAKIYVNNETILSDVFKAETGEILRAEAENIDFSDAQKAADIINKWVANKTNHKIIDLVPAYLLTRDTKLVLTNALYFLGEWRYKFNPSSTSSNDFYVSETNTVKVDTMHQVKYFKYAEVENLNAQALELPYVNNNLTCLIILPRDKNGATTLVSKLLDQNALRSVINSLKSARVAVSLPKFKTATTIDLKKIFQQDNITAIFDPRKSRLENILTVPQNLYVSAGIQKATIEVNESGSEAAAANAIVAVATSAVISSPIPFNADHPFIYYLLFRGSPIFCGLYAGN